MRSVWTDRIQVILLLPVSLLLAPLIAAGAVGMLLAVAASLLERSQPARTALPSVRLLFLMLGALAGLAAVWIVLVLGPERVKQTRGRRTSLQICLLLGIAADLYWSLRMGGPASYIAKYGAVGWILWIVLLVPPLFIGVRQSYLLARR
jgi:hypothetical protein